MSMSMAMASPPSSSSSPSHEFSFTISLHSSKPVLEAAKPPPLSTAIDLSPADDIFFHGHLLPLHLLSHLPVSPRSSTNSLDSFTLPITELVDTQITNTNSSSSNNNNSNTSTDSIINGEAQGRVKAKSFSLFRLPRRPKTSQEEDKEKHKRSLSFDINHVLKKYAKLIRPLLFSRERRSKKSNDIGLRRQAYSFSTSFSSRNKEELRRPRREFSAPVSMNTSPTNSGLLVERKHLNSTNDSSMEELQAAIQSAIAHCKNSIAKEDKIQW